MGTAVLLVGVAGIWLLAGDDESSGEPVNASVTTTTPDPTTSTSTSPTITPTTQVPAQFLLQRDGLGAVGFGETGDTAVAVLTDEFGPPDQDEVVESCPEGPTRFTTWADLHITSVPGPAGEFVSYLYGQPGDQASEHPLDLTTADGITIGSPVRDLRAALPGVDISYDDTYREWYFYEAGFEPYPDDWRDSGFLGATTGDQDLSVVLYIRAGSARCG